ncbi:DUF1573 domain-containing protein [Flavobacterium sp. XGLA_31]|uniref:DUF1573 domain-containing protein n=1 Tax=Flavobacterium sp. XGLA_31 TaxID=3447666 RepID=UPI003F331B7F
MIKRMCLVFVMATLALTTSCKKESNGTTEVTFETEEHDFGTITQGDKVTYEFKFKNTGNADFIIKDAKGSCGCTVPEYPKDPISPGDEETIKVSFNSAGKMGETTKTVTLFCNVKEGIKILHIKSNIVPKGTK